MIMRAVGSRFRRGATTHRYWIVLASILAWSATGSTLRADDGSIVYAFSHAPIAVDGDLSDWSDDCARFQIERPVSSNSTAAQSTIDGPVDVRVAYDPHRRALFVGAHVPDDSHVNDRSQSALSDNVDSLGLYLDLAHSKRGSGSVLFALAEHDRRIYRTREDWNPHNLDLDWDKVRGAVKRNPSATIYEWSIALGLDFDCLRRTIGFDILLVDADNARDGLNVSYAMWGKQDRKASQAGRVGDLVFAQRGDLGFVKGGVNTASALRHALLDRVTIESVSHPNFWLNAPVSPAGTYHVQLPAGRYRISPADSITAPFQIDTRLEQRKLEFVPAQVAAEANRTIQAMALSVSTVPPPQFPKDLQGLHSLDAPNYETEIGEAVSKFQEYYAIPGVSFAIVKSGNVVCYRASGVRNSLTGEPVTRQTLFEAASVTKAVFAFAAMRLVERGLLDLDRPLSEYAPWANIADDPRSKTLTARHVLTHRSGLPNWAWGGPGGWESGEKRMLEFAPGDRFQYSGEAFNYLGRVVETITGSELAQVLHDEVVLPMGMSQTWFCDNEQLSPVSSLGHYGKYCAFDAIQSLTSPASSMHTEASDFANFLIGLLQRRGLESSSYDQMFDLVVNIPQAQQVRPSNQRQGIGLGFFVRDSPLGRVVEHGGSNGDFHCKFAVIPEQDFGYAIFTNSNTGHNLVHAFEEFLLQP